MYRTGSPPSPHPTISSGSWRKRASETLFHTLLLLTASFSPLSAQFQSSGVAEFQRLNDSLATSTDTAALRSLLRSSKHHQKFQKENFSAALRAGLVALRLGELHADA